MAWTVAGFAGWLAKPGRALPVRIMLRIPEPLVTMAKSASPSSRLTVLPLAAPLARALTSAETLVSTTVGCGSGTMLGR